MGLFPIHCGFESSIRSSTKEDIEHRQFTIDFFFVGEFDVPCLVYCVEMVCELLYCSFFDDFKHVIHIPFPESGYTG